MGISLLDLLIYNEEKSINMTLNNFKLIFRQLLYSLKSIHEKNVAHCDIKPENILTNIFQIL